MITDVRRPDGRTHEITCGEPLHEGANFVEALRQGLVPGLETTQHVRRIPVILYSASINPSSWSPPDEPANWSRSQRRPTTLKRSSARRYQPRRVAPEPDTGDPQQGADGAGGLRQVDGP